MTRLCASFTFSALAVSLETSTKTEGHLMEAENITKLEAKHEKLLNHKAVTLLKIQE
jgi:hypothetical protein